MQRWNCVTPRLFDGGQDDFLPPFHFGLESLLWNLDNGTSRLEEVDVIDAYLRTFLKNPLQLIRLAQRLNQPKAGDT